MAKRRCPVCNAEVRDKDDTCWQCFSAVPKQQQESVCPHCERTIKGSHAFCPLCGSSLQEKRKAAQTSVVAEVEIDAERLERLRQRQQQWGLAGQSPAVNGDAAPRGQPVMEQGVNAAVATAAAHRLGGYETRVARQTRPLAPLAASGLLAGVAWFAMSILYLVGRPAMTNFPVICHQEVVSDTAVVMSALAWLLLGAAVGAISSGAAAKNHLTAAKVGGSLGVLMGLATGLVAYLAWKSMVAAQASIGVPGAACVLTSVFWSLAKGILLGVLTVIIFRAIFKQEAAAHS